MLGLIAGDVFSAFGATAAIGHVLLVDLLGLGVLDAGKFRMGASERKKRPEPLKAGRVRSAKPTTER